MGAWSSFAALAALLFVSCTAPDSSPHHPRIVATYSIVAADPKTGEVGVAVQSRFFGVGSVVPWARAGVGAVATQASADITYGSKGLKLLASGKSPATTLKLLTEKDRQRESRQCGIVDARGRSAAFTGRDCLPFASHRTAKNVAIQGNILAGPGVLDAMMRAFARRGRDSRLGAGRPARGRPAGR